MISFKTTILYNLPDLSQSVHYFGDFNTVSRLWCGHYKLMSYPCTRFFIMLDLGFLITLDLGDVSDKQSYP